MKLSEIRKLITEYDEADRQLTTDSDNGYIRDETVERRNAATIALNDLDLEALVRQWLSVVEAAKALEIYSDDFCNLYPSQESLEKLTNLLEGIEE